MWRAEAFRNFRRSILATHRNLLHTGYFISWDEKKRCATPLEKGWHYRIFQICALFCIFVVMPTVILRLYQLLSRGGADVVEIWFAYLCIVYLWLGVHYLWYFVWPEGVKKFVHVYASLLSLEKKLQGERLCKYVYLGWIQYEFTSQNDFEEKFAKYIIALEMY